MSNTIIGMVALADKFLMGKKGGLPWHNPEDLKFFKKQTENKTIVMGRKTWESIGSKPLPNRVNIVITSDKDYTVPEGVFVYHDIDELITYITSLNHDCYIIGGNGLFVTLLKTIDKFLITNIKGEYEGDVFLDPKVYRDFEFCKFTTYGNLEIDILSRDKNFPNLKLTSSSNNV
jgi:dihydrofolate reductase